MKWKRANKGFIDEPIIDYLEKMFDDELEKGYTLKVCVGTDSQKAGKGYKFATVILIITSESLGKNEDGIEQFVGKGGMIISTTFWEEMKASTNKKKHREIEILNQRMIKEVSKSIEVAYEISPVVDLYGVKLEIHADINPDPDAGLSNIALNEAIGYILGMGYEFKVKPDAWAATSGADRLC